ncbi:MAG: hypothetical protein H0W08_03500 [Acidobacteria bacterium]|nr:hypothetical protein [Acidobacteriota bacterium]
MLRKPAIRPSGGSLSERRMDHFPSGAPRVDRADLNSLKYSFTVYLIPKVAGSSSIADAAVEFVKLDQATPEELERLQKLNVLIREKHVPIANLGLYKPGDVVAELDKLLPWQINSHVHVRAWKTTGLGRPPGTLTGSGRRLNIAFSMKRTKITSIRKRGSTSSPKNSRTLNSSRRL